MTWSLIIFIFLATNYNFYIMYNKKCVTLYFKFFFAIKNNNYRIFRKKSFFIFEKIKLKIYNKRNLRKNYITFYSLGVKLKRINRYRNCMFIINYLKIVKSDLLKHYNVNVINFNHFFQAEENKLRLFY